MSSIYGRRTYMGGPWVFCDRCGVKTLVSQTKRQFGFLFCIPNNCVDKWILGQREARTAQVVAMLPGREMQPVPKVTMEDSNDAGLDAIQFGF